MKDGSGQERQKILRINGKNLEEKKNLDKTETNLVVIPE